MSLERRIEARRLWRKLFEAALDQRHPDPALKAAVTALQEFDPLGVWVPEPQHYTKHTAVDTLLTLAEEEAEDEERDE